MFSENEWHGSEGKTKLYAISIGYKICQSLTYRESLNEVLKEWRIRDRGTLRKP